MLAGISALADGIICELYSFKLKNGTFLRYTTHQFDLTWDGHSYLCAPLGFKRGSIPSSSEDFGFTVQEVDVSLYPRDSGVFISGVSLAQFVNEGGFDNAVVTIYRARSTYVVHLFEGLVTQANSDRTSCDLKISDPKMLFNIDMPRNVYQPGCRHVLFDSGCTLNKEDFRHDSSVLTGSSVRVIHNGLTQADSFFDLGEIVFTSGVNNGVIRSIKDYQTGVITLTLPLSVAPAIGDTFKAYPGCDGVRTTCKNTFDNEINFGGQPYVPVPEVTL